MTNKRKSLRIVAVTYLLLAVICVSNLQAMETDTMRVSGIVTYGSEPMPGTRIRVKETSIGTVTDINGKYSLTVPKNAILQFSYIGYSSQEIVVGNQQVINVEMDIGKDIESTGIKPAIPVSLTKIQNNKAEADNSFAFKMFREVSKQGDNIFFSPFSLNMALGMLYNGSSGNARAEMVKALGIADLSESEINEYYQIMSQALLEVDPTTEIGIANSIWYRKNLPVKNSFIELSKKYFDAEIQALGYNAANVINQWCAAKTNNRINNIVSNPISDDMMMYLINALYFKSKWQKEKKFDKENTKLEDFTKTNHQKKQVNMMEQTNYLHYYADQYLQCVEIPYGNTAFSMIAILPAENMSINQLIEYLDNEKWQYAVNRMRQQRVWLKLPRFKIECELPLNKPVQNLGMTQIFNEHFANFTNIADAPLCVSEIKQKTFVEVNEEGTEAAAITAVIIGYGATTRGTVSEPIQFFANCPFLYLIKEKSTGAILFIGRMDEPKE